MKTNHTQQHHHKGQYHHAQPDPGSYSWKLLLIQDARVHYVVLKQQPHTTHPTHPKACRRIMAGKPETTSHHQPPQTRDHQQSCCLRTQQCAKHENHHIDTPTVPEPPGFVLGKDTTTQRPLFVDIPPMSTRHETFVRATGLYS